MALETEHRLLLGVEIKKKLKEFSLELSFEAEKGSGGGKYCRRLKGKGRKGCSGGQEVPGLLPSGH